jgi:hypothetical protein
MTTTLAVSQTTAEFTQDQGKSSTTPGVWRVEGFRHTYAELWAGSDLVRAMARLSTSAAAEFADAATYRLAVAKASEAVIGIAVAGPASTIDAPRPLELYALHLGVRFHGTGAGQALLDSVLGDEPAFLWLDRHNTRALAFFRRNHFRPEWTGSSDPRGLTEIRMLR